jgi:hypothetical protein
MFLQVSAQDLQQDAGNAATDHAAKKNRPPALQATQDQEPIKGGEKTAKKDAGRPPPTKSVTRMAADLSFFFMAHSVRVAVLPDWT